jgi:hypothetical protein
MRAVSEGEFFSEIALVARSRVHCFTGALITGARERERERERETRGNLNDNSIVMHSFSRLPVGARACVSRM